MSRKRIGLIDVDGKNFPNIPYTLRDLGYWAYVMVYDKEHCKDAFYKRLQRWVNNRIVFAACDRFEDYNEKLG